MVKMSGGEALVKSLVREGVEAVFGIGGIHMSGTIVALRDELGIRLITTRHEAGATHMADGYARFREPWGSPSGPGHRFRLLVQPRFFLPHCAGRKGG